MSLVPIYLEICPKDIAYIKFILESYEEVGIIRTIDRKKAIVVLLAVSDFIEVARAIVKSLQQEVTLIEIPPPPDLSDDWLMTELAIDP
ncbi:MAG TPA: DUF4911 domain-containing protein [Candidatus Binatia bacterium]|jgi:Domain of unknown function (DUF4911)|nr:DUF4911 domain-containing protein [Candidatus Binatia bacterium]